MVSPQMPSSPSIRSQQPVWVLGVQIRYGSFCYLLQGIVGRIEDKQVAGAISPQLDTDDGHRVMRSLEVQRWLGCHRNSGRLLHDGIRGCVCSRVLFKILFHVVQKLFVRFLASFDAYEAVTLEFDTLVAKHSLSLSLIKREHRHL